MKIKDRIKRFDRIPASGLIPNPRNWRTHPTAQADALRGVLAEVGYADAVVVRETPDGLQLLDGHLRADISGDQMIPCLVVDVTDEESDKILASHDSIGAMAEVNAERLEELLRDMETQSQALDDLFESMAQDAGFAPPDFDAASADDQGQLDETAKIECPHCGHTFDK